MDVSSLPIACDVSPRARISDAYREHAPFICRVVRRLIGDGPHVDDVLQETFVVAFRRLATFDERSTLRTWLYGIAVNLCRRHVRSRSRFRAFTDRLLGHAPAPPVNPDPIERNETARRIDAALAKLPFEQREVVILYELEQHSGAEIAALVGVPVATVWTRLHRGRASLKRSLAPGGTR